MHSPRVDNGRVEHNDEKCVFMPSNTSWQVPIYIASVDCVQVVVQNYIDIWVWPLLGLFAIRWGFVSGGNWSFSFVYCSLGRGVELCLVHLLRKLVLTLCLAYETKHCYVRRAQGFLQDYCLNREARNQSLRGGTAKGLGPSVGVHVTSSART